MVPGGCCNRCLGRMYNREGLCLRCGRQNHKVMRKIHRRLERGEDLRTKLPRPKLRKL